MSRPLQVSAATYRNSTVILLCECERVCVCGFFHFNLNIISLLFTPIPWKFTTETVNIAYTKARNTPLYLDKFHCTTFVACYMAVYLQCTSHEKSVCWSDPNVTAFNWKQILCTNNSGQHTQPTHEHIPCTTCSMHYYTVKYTRINLHKRRI